MHFLIIYCITTGESPGKYGGETPTNNKKSAIFQAPFLAAGIYVRQFSALGM